MGRDFFQFLKKIVHDWDIKIMSWVMVVVTTTCVIAATVAWFTTHAAGAVRAMQMQTASGDTIKVAIETGGKDIDILREEGENPLFLIEMPMFSNMEAMGNEVELQFAPGVYGSVTLYVTALKEGVVECKITPEIITESVDATALDLLQGHILFFENRTETDGVATYSKHLTEESPLIRELEWNDLRGKGVEEEIVIYWYWPYEYADLPTEITRKISKNRERFFEPDKDATGEYTDAQLYDEADTYIGANIENINFHFEVKAGYE